MDDHTSILSTSAMALSSSTILAALIGVLKAKAVLTDEDETMLYETALQLLEELEESDDSGVVELAREVIEAHLGD